MDQKSDLRKEIEKSADPFLAALQEGSGSSLGIDPGADKQADLVLVKLAETIKRDGVGDSVLVTKSGKGLADYLEALQLDKGNSDSSTKSSVSNKASVPPGVGESKKAPEMGRGQGTKKNKGKTARNVWRPSVGGNKDVSTSSKITSLAMGQLKSSENVAKTNPGTQSLSKTGTESNDSEESLGARKKVSSSIQHSATPVTDEGSKVEVSEKAPDKPLELEEGQSSGEGKLEKAPNPSSKTHGAKSQMRNQNIFSKHREGELDNTEYLLDMYTAMMSASNKEMSEADKKRFAVLGLDHHGMYTVGEEWFSEEKVQKMSPEKVRLTYELWITDKWCHLKNPHEKLNFDVFRQCLPPNTNNMHKFLIYKLVMCNLMVARGTSAPTAEERKQCWESPHVGDSMNLNQLVYSVSVMSDSTKKMLEISAQLTTTIAQTLVTMEQDSHNFLTEAHAILSDNAKSLAATASSISIAVQNLPSMNPTERGEHQLDRLSQYTSRGPPEVAPSVVSKASRQDPPESRVYTPFGEDFEIPK